MALHNLKTLKMKKLLITSKGRSDKGTHWAIASIDCWGVGVYKTVVMRISEERHADLPVNQEVEWPEELVDLLIGKAEL